MDTTIKNYIELLTPEYRSFLASNFFTVLAQTFGKKHNLAPEQIEQFQADLLFFALFFYTKEEFEDVTAETFSISKPDAVLLTTAILQVFPETYDVLHEQITTLLQADNSSTATPPPAAVAANLANEIAEAEATMQKMQPIRTMSRDIEVMRAATEEPTHTSASQADLLKREAPASTDASAESTDTAQK